MPQVILALPAFNEAQCLPLLLEAANRVLAPLSEFSARIVVVDDGSTDGTADVARAFPSTIPIDVVQHPENRGLGAAIITSLHAALERSADPLDVIVNMDSDYTHPVETIPAMLAELDRGVDVVIASRYRKGSRQVGVPLKRRLLSWGARWLFAWRLRLPGVRDYTCGFRAYHARTIRRAFETYGDRLITREGFACTDDILVNLARMAPRPLIAEVPFVLRYDRKMGESKLPLLKTVRETLKMLFGVR
ncbi:glycosyltransferase [Candidatus Sumerlaeota bacterium]|nr:glycosyltransferase [Candidatus Sumerlaeota bacterium]